jgi:hypothetical protein
LSDDKKKFEEPIFVTRQKHTQFLLYNSFYAPAGLPDGIFSYQKSQFGYIFAGLAMLKVWLHFVAILNILRQLGKFYGQVAYFVIVWYISTSFGMFCQEKIWQPRVPVNICCATEIAAPCSVTLFLSLFIELLFRAFKQY